MAFVSASRGGGGKKPPPTLRRRGPLQPAAPVRSRVGYVRGLGGGRGPGGQENAGSLSGAAAIEQLVAQGNEWRSLLRKLVEVASPYWSAPAKTGQGAEEEEEDLRKGARLRFASVLALSLAGTGVSVGFNFLSRDFFNALTEKNQEVFMNKLIQFPLAYAVGIPVFVFRDYLAAKLSLRWREWMTKQFLEEYLEGKAFYNLQAGGLIGVIDNPDQRVNEDIKAFTSESIAFVLTLFSALIDLISFSGILYSIYPPLFVALIVYAVGGTAISILLGRPLVGLNFKQEMREADFRYALVRVRENAESIAFYGGEESEFSVLRDRFRSSIQNLSEILLTSRNLQFFTSFYRLLIQIVPAAVVAPLYFKGSIEFGVVNQAQSAFNHILSDFSLVVYQIEGIAGFSAVIQRLGQFEDTLQQSSKLNDSKNGIEVVDEPLKANEPVLRVQDLTLQTPNANRTLLKDLSFELPSGGSLLVSGPSGSGKTSLLRALAGLWSKGHGKIHRFKAVEGENHGPDIFFLPQRPYMVLGSLRNQLLYPVWSNHSGKKVNDSSPPSDSQLIDCMHRVGLSELVAQPDFNLDKEEDWAPKLSLGEQQRVAFARLLLCKPRIAVLDESTSALDEKREALLYSELKSEGIAYVSVGHRSSLNELHEKRICLGTETEEKN